MKILIVSHGFPPQSTAGTERQAGITARELIQRGHEVAVFCPWNKQSNDEQPEIVRYTIPKKRRAALWQDFSPYARWRFRQACREFNPQTVLFHHTLYQSYDLPLVAKKFGAHVVFVLHDFWLACPRSTLMNKDSSLSTVIDRQRCAKCLALHDHPKAKRNPLVKIIARPWFARRLLYRRDRIEKQLYDKIDAFVSPSQTVADVIKRRGLDQKKIHIIPYGLPGLTSKKRPAHKIRFGFIGTLTPHKGAAWLIEAFTKPVAPDATLTIWGPLEKPGELSNKKSKRITYAGSFKPEEVASIYSKIDCLIVPSRWPENQPLVILQAWQTGTPVIAGNLGGMSELVTHNVNGLLFDWTSADSLREQIFRFIDDGSLRQRLSLGAQKTAVPTPSDHVDRLIKLLSPPDNRS